MKSLILLCIVLVHCSWSYGSPGPESSRAFAYVDTAGNRYECVYKPQYNSPDSSHLNKFNEVNFRQDIFDNIENQQRAAFEAVQSSFDAFNAFPYIPNFNFRFPFHDNFKFGSRSQGSYGMSGTNSAFASGAVGPGYRHQVAAIDPANPHMPNVDTLNQYPLNNNRLGNDFYGVSSSSYSSSVNDNGELKSQRGAETIVNDRGQITRYSVHS